MTYGTIKVDTVTFTDAGVDKSVTLSGLVQNPTFSGNVTVTGTLSGVTVTGTTANFTSGNFTNISGGTHTITSGVFASGSAASPSITFTGDLNTGIYSPGADQVAISTGGSGRLFVDASGLVGVGTGSPSFPLHVSSTDFPAIGVFRALDVGVVGSAGQEIQIGALSGSTPTSGAAITGVLESSATAGNLLFKTLSGGVLGERLRITSTGTVNIVGAGSAGSTQAVSFNGSAPVDSLVLTSGGLVGVGTSSPGTLVEGRITGGGGTPATSGTSQPNAVFRVSGSGTTGVLDIGCNSGAPWIQSTDRTDLSQKYSLLLNPNGGSVGIGTSSPGSFTPGNLVVEAATTAGITISDSTGGGTASIAFSATPSFQNKAKINCTMSSQSLEFSTATQERMRIDSSGRLLVGTSSARTKWFNLTLTGPLIQAESGSNQMGVSSVYTANDASGPIIALGKTRGSLYEVVSSGDDTGVITFQGGDGSEMVEAARITAQIDGTPGANDMPGRLVFSTTADGASSPTERMRITNGGLIDIGGLYSVGANAIRFDVQGSNFSRNTTSSATQIAFVNPNGTVGTITTSGSATAYNTSSDYRLKENVSAVTDGITRLQQLKPSRFNFIADPTKTVDGFIAHEVQTVVPEAISGEKDAVDADGKPIYQGIDQSKLVPLLTAALQEAITKIESLEARLTGAGI